MGYQAVPVIPWNRHCPDSRTAVSWIQERWDSVTNRRRSPIAGIMEQHQHNSLATQATVAATATLGATAGFLLGCVLAIQLAAFHLKGYLDRVAAQDIASQNEAGDLLGVLQHSAYPPCSDAELNYFRGLIFHSDSLRDAGRMYRGKIKCSATDGRPLHPIGQFKVAPTEPDETLAGSELIPIRDRSLKKAGIRQGDLFVIFGSHLPDVQGSLPIHSSVDWTGGMPSGSSSHDTPDASSGGVPDSVTRQGVMLVAEHCSTILSNCVTASVSVNDARRGEFVAIAGTSVAGGTAGALLGFVLCVLVRRKRSLDRELRRAVAQEKLRLVYQPIVNLSDRKIVGAEVLARWAKPDGTSITPDVFIKLAEENGFVGSITRFVLRRALKEFREVFKEFPDFRLNINVAPADLVDPQFLPMLDRTVSEAKVRPKNLALEVTERSTASREDAMESIRELRRMGYAIYIDDFGTGYSNLSYLLYLSVDTIKIDQAFIRAIGTDAVTVAILPQIVAMARSLNLGIVVEGIESPGQADYFSTNNVRIYGQGWLYGRPVPACEFFQLMGLTVNPKALAANAAGAGLRGAWRQPDKEIEAATVPSI